MFSFWPCPLENEIAPSPDRGRYPRGTPSDDRVSALRSRRGTTRQVGQTDHWKIETAWPARPPVSGSRTGGSVGELVFVSERPHVFRRAIGKWIVAEQGKDGRASLQYPPQKILKPVILH